MARKTRRWDAAENLETKEDIAAYLDAVLEDGDPDLLKAALSDIAPAKGVTEISRKPLASAAPISTKRCRRTATQSSLPSPKC
jgi:DNA-binding phage protein